MHKMHSNVHTHTIKSNVCIFHTVLTNLQHILRDIAESGIDNSNGPHKAQVHKRFCECMRIKDRQDVC